MVEVMFEILLFSAYLSAALISVVIAVYAISVSYLGRETWRSIWFLKKRQTKLKHQIKEFQNKIDVGEMEKAIKRYREEVAFIQKKLHYLSLKGAVENPLSVFFSSLFFSLLGMWLYSISSPTDIPFVVIFILVALGGNAIGIGFLYRVLQTVEWAALRVPLPKFRTLFESLLNREKMKPKEKRGLRILICNEGDIMAEDLEIYVFFPPDFKVVEQENYNIVLQTGRADYLGYNAVILEKDKIHIDIDYLFREIVVKAPKKIGEYKIPICIQEKNIGESDHELFIEVVE